ncbi:MAG: hypothetical protein HYT12_01410 [Candidatus Liptonbacteria bacterium]|nr:hypothetical protein [Candidatus Liptonbacteria bacterium]
MRIMGLRDIKTHSTLAREGRLVGVARNLHRQRNEADDAQRREWKVERYIFKKPAKRRASNFHRELYLEKKVKLRQIEVARDLLEELHQAIAEGIPVAAHELERLRARLAQLEAE